MLVDRILALAGLSCAIGACMTDSMRVAGWAMALAACVLLVRPFRDLARRASDLLGRIEALSVVVAPPPSMPANSTSVPRPSVTDARINAAIDLFMAAKRERYQRHVRR